MFDGTDGKCWLPDWPVSMEREPRIRIAKFGDGYEQRIIDGLNPMQTTWHVSWKMRARTLLVDMETYLTAQYGAAFPFLDPQTEAIVQVFCDSWQLQWQHKGRNTDYGDLSADFRRAYGASIGVSALP